KQRVVLAAVLAMQPKYLLLDEPTSSLDLYRRQMLGEYLQDICAQSGCGIIIISHDENFVQSYCHDIFMMSKRN
ncbi:MAG: ABC transporter ATP-binding protein, partial [Clostridiales bacterium]